MGTSGFQSQLVCFLVSLTILGFVSSTSQGDALIAVKSKWQADDLPSWLAGTDPCNTAWEGVTCNAMSEVDGLNLTNKGLKGPVPEDISILTSLRFLDLSYSRGSSGVLNQLTGDLSPLGSLTNLAVLNLSFSVRNSEFPLAVLQLTNLVDLRIDNSGLTGPFPTKISDLINLQYLYLGNNSMTGNLPSELERLVNLVELTLWKNPFNSRIPVELSNLDKLTYLNLHSCGLWGGLPSEFGNLARIVNLDLHRNKLTGNIPDSWQRMSNLSELILDNNFLSKDIPSWVLTHPRLKNLKISFNQLYGSLPEFINNSLQRVILRCNYFNGPWPVAPKKNLSLDGVGNCFSNVTSTNDNSIYLCSRTYSCNGFSQQLSGGCPPCPQGQFRTDATLCICEAASENDKQSTVQAGKIAGLVLGAVFLFLLLGLLVVFRWRNANSRESARLGTVDSVRGVEDYWEVPEGVQRFSLQDLAKATSNFHNNNVIGAGGFGKVFYGVLDNGKKVAIKRACQSSMRGSSEFRTEVTLLSRLHHRNLVRLEGFCEDSGLQMLVYEYMMNGSLHKWLSQSKVDTVVDWCKRLDIAVGIAQGLEYLHSFADPPVIHRDVKPSNVLLDENLVAKLGDFGISKVTPEFETHVSTIPAGTAGFIDPQYYLRGQLTTASDVYGFGVVVLELLTGQKAIDNKRTEEQNLLEWVKLKLRNEGCKSVVDPRIGVTYPEEVYKDVIRLAVDCASFEKEDRPSMKAVVTILDACVGKVYRYPRQEILLPQDELDEVELSLSTTLSESMTIAILNHASVLPR